MIWQTIRPWLWRAVWTLVAAVAVLLLGQVHFSIVRTALTQAGARDDAPLILEILDACGARIAVPLFWRTPSDTLVTCPGPAVVRTTAPQGRPFALFVNGRLAGARNELAAVTNFNVTLRPGSNQVAVFGKGTQLAQPFAARFSDVSTFRPPHYDGSSLQRLWRNLPLLPVATTAYVTARPSGERSQRQPPRPLGHWDSYDVYLGSPDADAELHPEHQILKADTGPDGLALFWHGDAATAVPAAEVSLSREITVERDGDGRVTVSGSACLPHDHTLVAWAKAGALDAPEFISRIAAVRAVNWAMFDPSHWPAPARVAVEEAASGGGCDRLAGTYSVTNPLIIQTDYHPTFLRLPGDRLTVRGFGDTLRATGRQPDAVDGAALIWTSHAEGGAPYLLSEAPAEARSAASPPAATDAERRSGLFNAWRSLPDLLPNLARAVMLGLAAAAPVALIY